MAGEFDRVKELLIGIGLDERYITLQAAFVNDLGMDSLDLVEAIMMFEEEFSAEVSDEEAQTWIIVADAVRFAERLAKESKQCTGRR